VTRLDRYLLSQLMALFGFFSLVLVSVYWVNQAVLLFDKLISDGQTAWVVLEFTALALPNVIRLVLPVSAFAAVIYAVNRLSSESELVVMRAAGGSPWQLARPVAIFGVIVALMMVALVHVLVPVSRAQMALRQAQISENVTARFLTEGSFQHPAPGVTIYIREISPFGELLDIYLVDARSAANRTNYSAEKALIVRSDTGPKLIMFTGLAQTLRLTDRSLAITRFASFTYDIASLVGTPTRGASGWDELPSWALIAPGDDQLAAAKSTRATAWQVLNDRFAQPLLAPAAALIGFAALMLGSFSRFGMWRQIGLAIVGLIVLQFLNNAAESAMRAGPELWWLAYLPSLAGLSVAALLLWLAGRPRRVGRMREART